MKQAICEAERLGLKVGNTIFLIAGTAELICKDCHFPKCSYRLRDYNKKDYKESLRLMK